MNCGFEDHLGGGLCPAGKAPGVVVGLKDIRTANGLRKAENIVRTLSFIVKGLSPE